MSGPVRPLVSSPLPGAGENAPIPVKETYSGRIYTNLPRMWVGILIAFICLFVQLGDSDVLVLAVSVTGSCYWLFCVHRIHKVLAEYTLSKYPISPRKAVGFQLIPIFEYYWFFRWTRQVARFIDREGGATTSPKLWPGILLTITSFCGWFTPCKPIRLFLVFGFGIYLTRKLKTVLPASQPLRFQRSQQWNVSLCAGVGAAFSFILAEAIRNFSAKEPLEKVHELLAICLVSVGVLIFLEPVFEQLRTRLGIAEHHPGLPRKPPLRLAVFAILVFTSLFHGLLHSEIENRMDKDWIGTLTIIFAALVVSGGITYFWIGAAYHLPSHSARSGLISGAVLGFLISFAVLAIATPPSVPENTAASEQSLKQRLAGSIPFASSSIMNKGEDSLLEKIGIIAAPWPLFGLIGGFAIDRRLGKRKTHAVALTLVATALTYELLLFSLRVQAFNGEMLSHLSVAVGWGLALIVCSSSAALTPEGSVNAEGTSE